MEPIGKLVGSLPFVQEAIKKRNKKLLDYDRSRSTVKKLIERPSDDPTKLARVNTTNSGRSRCQSM
jgi:amphiphysin